MKKTKKQELSEKYKDVETLEDLMNLGIKPKTSSDHLALISYLRLRKIKDDVETRISDEMLGEWVSLIEPKESQDYDSEISDIGVMKRIVKPGMRIEGTGIQDEQDLKGEKGLIKAASGGKLAVEFDNELARGHNKFQCKPKHGLYVDYQNCKLIFDEPYRIISSYKVRNGVVAGKRLGHKIRFKKKFEKDVMDKNGHGLGNAKIPADTLCTLVNISEENHTVLIKAESKVEGLGDRDLFRVSIQDAYEHLQVSSLGQITPKNREDEVKKQTLLDFFPTTVLETARAERVAIAMLTGRDLMLYGPPGGGKTQTSKDIISIAKQQEIIFTVDGCQVQCNPFSLCDEDFAKKVPPCPECMIRFDPNYKHTGFFKRPDPKDVKVNVANYGHAFGVEKIDGTKSLTRMHLIGYKIPEIEKSGENISMILLKAIVRRFSKDKDVQLEGDLAREEEHRRETSKQNDYDPEGFRPGVLVRTNNGILVTDEFDKLRETAVDDYLEALNDNEVKPDQLRFLFPAHAMIVGTANDHTVFSLPLCDRMLLLAIRYPSDVDTAYNILRKAYHKEITEVGDVPVGDTHIKEERHVGDIVVPMILEKAVAAFYIHFRKEFNERARNKIMDSVRCMKDALTVSRCKWDLDRLFYSKTPCTPTIEHMMYGITYAMCSRVQIENELEEQDAKNKLISWIKKEFPKKVAEEERKWWCDTYKEYICVYDAQIPGYESNFNAEMAQYRQNLGAAESIYQQVKKAKEDPENEANALVLITYPFMSYLHDEQPGFTNIENDQLIDIIKYFVDSKKRSDAALEEGEKGE